MVGLPVEDEVAGISRRKKLLAARGIDDGGDFRQLHDD